MVQKAMNETTNIAAKAHQLQKNTSKIEPLQKQKKQLDSESKLHQL